jgi:hypothetical protein
MTKLDRKAEKDVRACSQCGKTEQEGSDGFSGCSACLAAWYCSRKCQRKHRPSHKEECAILARSNQDKVTLAAQTQEEINERLQRYNYVEGTDVDCLVGGYHKPDGVEANEKFILRITSFSRIFLLCYDESRTCCFVIDKTSKVLTEIFNKIQPNWTPPENINEATMRIIGPGYSGEQSDLFKTRRFYASFDENDDCTVCLSGSFY